MHCEIPYSLIKYHEQIYSRRLSAWNLRRSSARCQMAWKMEIFRFLSLFIVPSGWITKKKRKEKMYAQSASELLRSLSPAWHKHAHTNTRRIMDVVGPTDLPQNEMKSVTKILSFVVFVSFHFTHAILCGGIVLHLIKSKYTNDVVCEK